MMLEHLDFKEGDRVVMTEIALRLKLHGRKKVAAGIVVSISESNLIIVQRDGFKRSSKWLRSYWRKAESADAVVCN